MPKLEPPSAGARQSTQAVSDTTIEAGTSKSVTVSPVQEAQTDQNGHLEPVPSNVSGSFVLEDDDENLQTLLNGLIRQDLRTIREEDAGEKPEVSFLDSAIFPEIELTKSSVPDKEQEYFDNMIQIDKEVDQQQFHQKLKHFMIFSVSGKPIYSFHGTDELIIGYTGLITTIVSSFEQSLNEQVKTVDYPGLKIMILNKNPIILVSITKIGYEMALDQNTNENALLINQLNVVYEYLLSILSKTVINKLFSNRMNYDLRRSLTALDFKNLDDLCMKLTFGVSDTSTDFEFYLSALLDNSRKTMKITNSTRSKLNNMLLQSRDKSTDPDFIFGMLTYQDEVVSMMKPKNHNLCYKDIRNLLLLISNNQHQNMSEDLWIPICMANFNSNGFLYCYVKQLDLSKYLVVDGNFFEPLNLNIILLSTNKNDFYKMQEVGNKVIDQIIETESFRNTLYKEILHSHELPQVPLVHYIYKDKTSNQYISSDISLDRFAVLKFVHHYTSLYTSKTTTISSLTNVHDDRKLSYLKFDDYVGFMLSDKSSEFYCISREAKLNGLIQHSLTAIKWCKKNHKRLFNNVVQYSF